MRRTRFQKIKDFVSFPVRAFTLFDQDKVGFSSLRSERFDYVAGHVRGYCLDIGCGPHNKFVNEYLGGRGRGIDVFAYEGLSKENLVEDATYFPFPDTSFDTVTLIACINHIPSSLRDAELAEAYRCLRSSGNIVVTMGNPLAEIAVHKVVALHDKFLGTNYDVDSERGMHEDESYYLKDSEIVGHLRRGGFTDIKKKYFFTQWGLNHLFVGWKK